MVEEKARNITKLDRTDGTLSIIAPNIPQFWIANFLGKGAKVIGLEVNKESFKILLGSKGNDSSVVLFVDPTDFRTLSMEVRRGNLIAQKLTVEDDKNVSAIFPASSVLEECTGQGELMSREVWRTKEVSDIKDSSVKSKYTPLPGYLLKEKNR